MEEKCRPQCEPQVEALDTLRGVDAGQLALREVMLKKHPSPRPRRLQEAQGKHQPNPWAKRSSTVLQGSRSQRRRREGAQTLQGRVETQLPRRIGQGEVPVQLPAQGGKQFGVILFTPEPKRLEEVLHSTHAEVACAPRAAHASRYGYRRCVMVLDNPLNTATLEDLKMRPSVAL